MSNELSWHGRASISIQPVQHCHNSSPADIHSVQRELDIAVQQLARSRRRKRRYLLSLQHHRQKRRYRLSSHRRIEVPANINIVQCENMIRRLQGNVKSLSNKLKSFTIQPRSQHIHPDLPVVERFDIGGPSSVCQHCQAIMWKEESTHASQNKQHPQFTLCCNDGGVRQALAREPPRYLRDLMQSESANRRHFCDYIRAYNGVFCFTSMGGKVNRQLNDGSSVYIYSIGGQIFHRIGSLLPREGTAPGFCQLYIYDTVNEVAHRMNSFTTDADSNPLRPQIIQDLKDMFDEHNALTKIFRAARDRINIGDVQNVQIRLVATRPTDGREYDLPAVNELAGLIVDETGDNTFQPDIVVQYLSDRLERVTYTHASLMALQYPILFPYGEDGWHGNTHVSQCDWYAYRIQTRSQSQSHILLCGKLFQQYVVNAYALVDEERLDWQRKNQWILRRHVYHGLVDAFNKGDTDLEHSGKRMILSSSYIGSPRCKYENFQDAMAICRFIGYPDLFITFTCNAYWPEIQLMVDLLTQSGQRDPNRADVMARVFKLKLNQLMFEIRKRKIFGKCIGYVHAIEFQKRGLPHAHILVFLSAEDKIYSTSHIDSIICAEIPDSVADEKCYTAVSTFMFHGPCGAQGPKASCMVDGKCTKHFPKKFNPETSFDADGFPRYKRSDNGRHITKNQGKLDNRHVVPYNRYLLLRFDAHINVEYCNKSRAVKYLFKYINKPPDRARATVELGHVDEIQSFMDCRYLTAGEACWRLFKFKLYVNNPPVLRLSYHLPGEQPVFSNENSTMDGLLQSELAHTSMLLEWMEMNKVYPEARKYTFVEFPQYYVWNPQPKTWTRRKRGPNIGRLYYCQPSSNERFYLRMLLQIVKGCRSFDDLKTVNNVQYDSFKEACNAYGFLTDDGEWHNCLREVSFTASAKQMRILFVTLIMFSEVSNVGDLWSKNWNLLSDDIQYLRRQELNIPHLEISSEDVHDLCLVQIDKLLHNYRRTLSDFPGLPIPSNSSHILSSNSLLAEELHYDHVALGATFAAQFAKLNAKQKIAFHEITDSIQHNRNQLFFIDGYGGTGKTFLWQVISVKLRSEKKVVICVATAGIAALLMTGGRTAHSRFHIPIDVHSASTCHIEQGSELAELLENTSLIIWDEAPMAHKHCIESLDRSLRDILSRNNKSNGDIPFGGITVVFGGDFRQILPVIPKATRTEIVNSCIKRSYLWQHMTIIKLSENMRLKQLECTSREAASIAEFSSWILDIGDGARSSVYGHADIVIPPDLIVERNRDPIIDIVEATYGQLSANLDNPAYFASRAILAPLHEIVSQINSYMLDQWHGEEMCYYSSNSIQSDSLDPSSAEAEYPIEFLNDLQIGNFPAHELKLKVGVPVILLRNLDQTTGLCNGTRMVIRTMGTWFLEVEILTGTHIGDRVYLPRLSLTSHQKSLNFTLVRRQYPIALSFGMTINKSQGQTLQSVGLCLKRQVFTHGQLYVAVSRVTRRSGLKIISCDEASQPTQSMKNIVFREVLN
ncbi:ATP-dependent DNA helicase PIF1 [Linum grandiflorum]